MTDKIERYCEQLDRLAFKVIRRMGREVSTLLEEGMTPAQFLLMRLIGQQGEATVSDLSDQMGVTLSAITSLTDRLKAAGLVNRVRDESDRRVVFLRLTPEGAAKLSDLSNRRLEHMRRYLGQLPEEDIEKLLEIGERFSAILDDTPRSIKEEE